MEWVGRKVVEDGGRGDVKMCCSMYVLLIFKANMVLNSNYLNRKVCGYVSIAVNSEHVRLLRDVFRYVEVKEL